VRTGKCPTGLAWSSKAYALRKDHTAIECSGQGVCDYTDVSQLCCISRAASRCSFDDGVWISLTGNMSVCGGL
jgi:hypothetical protein